MKTMKQFPQIIIFLILFISCGYLDEQNEQVLTEENNKIELNAYAPFNSFTDKGYYCNQNCPNDNTLSSTAVSITVLVDLDMNGTWKVVKAWNYSVIDNNSLAIKTEYNDSIISQQPIITINGFNLSNSKNNQTFSWGVIDDEKLHSKFKTIKINDLNGTKLIIVDVSNDLDKIIIQSTNYYINADVSSNPYSFQRFLLERQ